MRMLMALLLGGWLLGTLLVAGVAAENFFMVDRLLRSPSPAEFQQKIAPLPPGEARAVLRHLVSELNRFYFRVWEGIELVLGAMLLVLAVKFGKNRSITIGVSLMLAIGLLMVFYITPQLVEIGRGLDFVPRDPRPPELARFGRLHAAYSVLDLCKLLVGIWVAVLLIRRPTES